MRSTKEFFPLSWTRTSQERLSLTPFLAPNHYRQSFDYRLSSYDLTSLVHKPTDVNFWQK